MQAQVKCIICGKRIISTGMDHQMCAVCHATFSPSDPEFLTAEDVEREYQATGGEPLKVIAQCQENTAREQQAKEEDCDHEWVLEDKGQPIDDFIKETREKAENLSDEGQKRGYLFEAEAAEKNKEKLKITACSVIYKCKKCAAVQELDLVGEGVIAECKSRDYSGIKKCGAQRKRYLSIQKQLNPERKPLAKLDGSRDEIEKSKDKYLERGHDVEVIN